MTSSSQTRSQSWQSSSATGALAASCCQRSSTALFGQQDAGGRLRFRPTDEQVLASIHLFRGRVVQMDAGEGKTVAIAIARRASRLAGPPRARGHCQ